MAPCLQIFHGESRFERFWLQNGATNPRDLPCPIMKQEKAACRFCPHAALTPARNAVRRRFTDVSFWEYWGNSLNKCSQSGNFQQVCGGVSSDKLFHKTAVLQRESKQMQFGDAKLLSGTKTVPASEKLLRGFSNYIRREKMVAAYRLCWREGKESCEVAYSRKSYWRSAHHVVDGADDAGDNEEGKKI